MALPACLPGLVDDGKMTPDQAAEARALYDELIDDFSRTGSPETAEALASTAVLDALERQVTRKQFLAGRTIKVRGRITADLQAYRGRGNQGGGPIDPGGGAALIDHDPRAKFSNVEGRRKAILGQAHRKIDRLLAEHSANLRGEMRNRAQMEDIARERFGKNTGNHAAREMAEAFGETAEMLRRRFNAAGGEIGFRADWGLPQSHDWKKVRAAGYEAWRAAIIDKLDPARMIDQRTGRPFTREGLEAALPEIFDTIRSDGWNKRSPGAPGKGALANRRADARFLVFKGADEWMAYARDFGAGTPYDAMMGHIEGMARDIAALEVLGPNPVATLAWVKDTITQSAQLDRSPDSKAVARAKATGKRIDELWAEYSLATMEPRHEKLALVFSGMRSLQTATKLGGAYLSSVSDFAFQQSRRSFNGLGGPGTMLGRYVKLMRPRSIEDQKLAVRRGLIAEEWAGRTAAQSRYLVQELTGEIPRRLAEGVLRLSLLSRHTQAMRWVYGMESLATYTEAAGRSFDQLEPRLRAALQRYGMGAGDWDLLRSAPMDLDRGVEWISPHNLDDQELASRFMEMILEETDLAVPTADLGTRAYMSKMERGTVIGEIGRSLFLFKSFGISVMLRQWQEVMAMSGAQAARYTGGLMIGTTLMGAVALQLKALAGGQDPRPMQDDKFWWAAMLQGGGFGIFGDFLHASENRMGGGFAQTIAGPLVDDAQGIANVLNARDPRRSIVREVKGFIPGNNLWYLRTAFDRMLADQIEETINPDYRASFRRSERYAAEQGTALWWDRGDMLPDDAPDFSNAIEEGPRQ